VYSHGPACLGGGGKHGPSHGGGWNGIKSGGGGGQQ